MYGDGCRWHDACLTCPLPKCALEMTYAERREHLIEKETQVWQQVADAMIEGLSLPQARRKVAEAHQVKERSIQRAIGREMHGDIVRTVVIARIESGMTWRMAVDSVAQAMGWTYTGTAKHIPKQECKPAIEANTVKLMRAAMERGESYDAATRIAADNLGVAPQTIRIKFPKKKVLEEANGR